MPTRKARQLILQAVNMKRQDDGIDWDGIQRAICRLDSCPLPTKLLANS